MEMAAAAWVFVKAAFVAVGTGTATLAQTATVLAVNVAGSMALSAAATALMAPKAGGRAPGEWLADPNAGIPFAIGDRIGAAGNIVYKNTFGKDNEYKSIVTVLSGAGPISAYLGFTADREALAFAGEAASQRYAGEMWMQRRLGDQPDTALTSPAAIAHKLPDWGATNRLSGKAAFMWTLRMDSKFSVYPQGEPAPVTIMRGIKGYDHRFDSTVPGGSGPCRLNDRSTYMTITNPIIADLNWCLGLRENGKVVGGLGALPQSIDLPAYTRAANVADINNWKIAAYPRSDEQKSEVRAGMLQAGGALISRRAGLISCVTRGAPKTHVMTISAADTAGPIELDTAANVLNRFNYLTPRYLSEAHEWQLVAAAPVGSPQYLAEDRGRLSSDQRDYPYVPAAKQAAELAALDVAHSREGIAGRWPLKAYCRDIEPGETFRVNEPGLLLDGMDMLVLQREFDPETNIAHVVFVSETAGKVAWALGQQANPPPTPSLSARHDLNAPSSDAWDVVVVPPSPEGVSMPAVEVIVDIDNARAEDLVVEVGPTNEGPWRTVKSVKIVAGQVQVPVNELVPGAEFWIALSYQSVDEGPSPKTVKGPFVAGPLISENTNNVGTMPAPVVVQKIEEILVSVEEAETAIGATNAEVASAKTIAVAALVNGALNANARFGQAWLTGQIPPGFADWVTGSSSAIEGALVGPHSLAFNDVPALERGLLQDQSSSPQMGTLTAGWWVVEATAQLKAGSLRGAGLHLSPRNALGDYVDSAINLEFSLDPDLTGAVVGDGVVGKTYRWSKLIRFTDPTVRQGILYTMANWTGFGSGVTAKSIRFAEVVLRPAKAGEIEAGAARGGYSTVSARMSAEEATRAGETGALALRQATIEAAARTHPNLMRNSDASEGLRYHEYAGVTTYGYDAAYGAIFMMLGGDTFSYWVSDYMRVYGDTAYTVSWEGEANAAPDATVFYFQFLRADFTIISDGQHVTNFVGVSWDVRKSVSFGTPADAVYLRAVLRKAGTDTVAFPFNAFWSRIMVNVGWTPVAWSDGATARDTLARLSETEGAMAMVEGRSKVWSQKELNAGAGATVFSRLLAENDNGTITSDVAFGAKTISLYNPSGDDWRLAMRVEGGNALFTGGLQAGAFIRLGNGNGWPVALKPVDFQATDGEVVNFGTDLGSLPQLNFAQNNLAPLNAGETYNVYAESLSATGFILRAKINIPAVPANQTTAAPGYAENLGQYPGRTLWLEGKAEAASGVYRVQSNGYQEHRFMGRQGQQIEADREDRAYTTLQIWAYRGGWGLVGTVSVESLVDPYQYPSGQMHTSQASWSLDETFQMGSGVSHVHILRVGADNGRVGGIYQLGPVNWQSQGAGSSVRSATPNGQKTNITVRPQ